MRKSNKVLFIETTGYISSNPNLLGIIEILSEHGFKVDILTSKRNFLQVSPSNNSSFIFMNLYVERLIEKVSTRIFSTNLIRFILKFKNLKNDYNLIFGIDTFGIIFANIIAKNKVPIIFISYEIFFKSEIGGYIKKIEQNACKEIVLGVSQDIERASILSKENKINIEKIINIPVSGRKFKGKFPSLYIKDKYCIPVNKKIAIVTGSIEKWTMADELLTSLNSWPDEWVLFLHNKHFNIDLKKKYVQLLIKKKLIISKEVYESTEKLYVLLNCADIGIALYQPTYESIYLGDNIKYLGMSSGKLSTYIQHGLPVIVNEIGLMSDMITKYKVGFRIKNINNMGSLLKTLNNAKIDEASNNCKFFFNQYLDLDNNIKPLLRKIVTA